MEKPKSEEVAVTEVENEQSRDEVLIIIDVGGTRIEFTAGLNDYINPDTYINAAWRVVGEEPK